VGPPFDAPHRSTSLGEFWGRRWNRAFSDMTALLVYRPLGRCGGALIGLGGAFVFSGLLHEVAISLPVRAGFGGPTAYFVLHALLVAIERRLAARGLFDWPPGVGRVWTAAWLIAPLPVLFHRAFLEGVIAAAL
jgi:alginate O-acetyltransferase complex protein AlgI